MKTYKSKIDVISLIITFYVFPSFILLKQIQSGDFHIYLPTIILTTIIYILIYQNVKYTFDGGSLNIKGGILINENIQLISINKISKNRNPFRRSIITNPIATKNCLVINHGNNKKILVSPNDTKSFIKDIQQVNPNVSISI